MGDPNKRTGNLSAEQAQYMRQGMRGPKYDASVPPSQRAGGAKSFDADKKRTRDTREIGGASGLLSKLERGEQPVSNAMKKASDAKFFKGGESCRHASFRKDVVRNAGLRRTYFSSW